MCRDTSAATAAPPVTGSEPPSQKSFCTSTTISAVAIAASQKGRRDRGLAVRELQTLPRHADQGQPQPLTALLDGRQVRYRLSSPHQGDLQLAVVLAELRVVVRQGGVGSVDDLLD